MSLLDEIRSIGERIHHEPVNLYEVLSALATAVEDVCFEISDTKGTNYKVDDFWRAASEYKG